MSTAEKRNVTPAEYLAEERVAAFKSEYYQGEVFAMVGASRRHNLITSNLVRWIHTQLDGRRCEVYASDMRVKVSPTGLYTYPDIAVVCDSPEFEDGELDTLLNPNVIIEVLSESTEAYDRGAKFEQYRRLDSLREYVLIAQDRVHIEHFARDDKDCWVLSETTEIASKLELPSISCTLDVQDIYARVEFGE
ncbi:MAG: Uma2 family endonuclease [Caldilineaceae bacterium]|nr:Uma2 family endonuclease [Planctomycetales bacterium]MCB0073882.1 Uma2 family endonuclease [Caldilineaceae bacterium]